MQVFLHPLPKVQAVVNHRVVVQALLFHLPHPEAPALLYQEVVGALQPVLHYLQVVVLAHQFHHLFLLLFHRVPQVLLARVLHPVLRHQRQAHRMQAHQFRPQLQQANLNLHPLVLLQVLALHKVPVHHHQ